MIHTGKPHDWVRIYVGEFTERGVSSIDFIFQCAICRLVKIEYGIGAAEYHPSLDMGCTRKCGIPARTLPSCDEEWGHDGDMHGNAGDGFYAHEYDAEHHRRQRERRRGGVK